MTTTMNLSRTDLAVETAEALPTGRDIFAPGTGVTKSECLLCGCPVTRIHVCTPAGARAIGKPKACRAVGMANHHNPIPILIPCHRVVGADGSLTGYAGGIDKKLWLLDLEGVETDRFFVPDNSTAP